MATLASSALTINEWAARLDPDGKSAAVIELLGQTNEMLTDMLWMQCNDGTNHKTTVRTGLPAATWRLLNYGVQKSKGTTAQVKDATGMLEAYSEIDKDLADLNGNSAEFRLGEDMAFIESMNQSMQFTVLYGSTAANPERFTGLAPRFSAISAGQSGTINTGLNIIDAGGSGSTNTSIWLVGWGQNAVHGLFPQGLEGRPAGARPRRRAVVRRQQQPLSRLSHALQMGLRSLGPRLALRGAHRQRQRDGGRGDHREPGQPLDHGGEQGPVQPGGRQFAAPGRAGRHGHAAGPAQLGVLHEPHGAHRLRHPGDGEVATTS